MFNIIIFLIGAGIMFYMAWRSWSRRRKLMTRGEKVEAAVAGTVQSRGDKSVLGAEVLYVVLGIVLLVLMAGIVR